MILNTLLQTSTVHVILHRVCACVRSQVRAPEGDSRGLLWVLDEEMVTPGSTESTVLERVCQSFSGTGTSVWFWPSPVTFDHTLPHLSARLLLSAPVRAASAVWDRSPDGFRSSPLWSLRLVQSGPEQSVCAERQLAAAELLNVREHRWSFTLSHGHFQTRAFPHTQFWRKSY